MDNGANQLLAELGSVIKRYSQESDVTIAEAIGVVCMLKAQLLDDAIGGEAEECVG